ncbi:MAG: MFS transporter [Myxococcales bacterium]|nr:MFS transporter [Myxococcales bacterium]
MSEHQAGAAGPAQATARPSAGSDEARVLGGLVNVRVSEWPAVLWSFLYFFCLLSGYYVLRPVRDEMGILGGIKNLPWMFSATFVGMLATLPIFGLAAARWPRSKLVPGVYFFVISNLLVFFVAMYAGYRPAVVAKVFFVWLSVVNYFIVSVFWSFMSDLYESEQAKRLFPVIAAGGSVGAIVGPAITAALVKHIGIASLFLVSAGLFTCATVCISRLSDWAKAHSHGERQHGEAVGGGIFSGVRLALSNPYLLAIAGYILLLQVLGTFFYLEQTRVVSQTLSSSTARTQLFAQLDLSVNGLTLLLQIFVTGRLVLSLGLSTCLVLLPVFGGLGLLTVGLWPTLWVVAAASVVRRATEFAISKPAREVLFTVVTREERYKAKNVIDTLVSRGGDAASGWAHNGLTALGINVSQMAFASLPAAVAMIAVGLYLGKQQEAKRKAAKTADA